MSLNRMKFLSGIITEDVYKDLEKIAFGDLKKADEPDTEWEAKVFKALDDYIMEPGSSEREALAQYMPDLFKLKPKYPDDLVPNVTTVYRGIQLSGNEYKQYINSEQNIMLTDDYVYNSRSSITSWTADAEVAKSFALQEHAGIIGKSPDWIWMRPCPAIVKATVDKSFILNTNLTNRFRNDPVAEHEILRYANEPIITTLFIDREWLQRYKQHNKL
jgi:hypothetical protein